MTTFDWKMTKIYSMLLGAAALAMLTLVGCLSPQAGTSIIEATSNSGTLIKHVFSQNYSILYIIGGLSSLLAAGSLIARAFGIPIPVRVISTAAVMAVGFWVVHYMLVKYIYLMGFLAIAGVIISTLGFAYSHIEWLEKLLGVDINRDGTIGKRVIMLDDQPKEVRNG